MCVTCMKQNVWKHLVASKVFWSPEKRQISIFGCLTVAVTSDSSLPAGVLFVPDTPWPVLKDISPCGQNIMLILTSLMSIIISFQPHAAGSKCLNPKKHFWTVRGGTGSHHHHWQFYDCISWLLLMHVILIYIVIFWEIWFCAYQFHCCYCHNSGQAIMWEWTAHVWCLYVTHLSSPLSVECLDSIGCFHIGRPTTDKAWLCSAWVAMAMPLQHSARA